MNRRVVLAITALIGLLGGGYLGWLNWRASLTTVAQPSSDLSETRYQKFPACFEEATTASGLDFQHWCGDGGKYFFPEVMGSGIALLDYDRDGKLDLFVVQGMPAKAAAGSPPTGVIRPSPTSRLYRQEEQSRFRDVTDQVGLADEEAYGMGAAVGDVNNDGWPDLYVTKYGRDRLFLNREGQFIDITESAGIINPRWGTSAGFIDFDRDGWLDLFVTNYVDYFPSQRCIQASGVEDYCHPRVFEDAPSRFFRNLTGESGEAGEVRFQDVSLESGIDAKPGPGLGVLFDDFSGDGWPDILVANDSKANFLWVNRHDGTFVDEAIAAGAAYDRAGRPQANMGIACGDVDGDGRNDLLITHLDGEYDTLYLQLATGVFEDRSIEMGLGSTIPPTGFGTALGDLDLDGDLDLVTVNGRVRRPDAARNAPADPVAFWQAYAERNAIFMNQGSGKFVEADPAGEPFCTGQHVSRGLAIGDLDNDGDLDLVTTEVNGPARIYQNVAPRRGNWLQVRAIDPSLGSRDVYGAVVTVKIAKRALVRTVTPASSYLSSSDPRVHLGLATADTFDEIRVAWPDGEVESFPGGKANRQLTLQRGAGAIP